MQTETDRLMVAIWKLTHWATRLAFLVLMVLSTFYWKDGLQLAFWTVLYVLTRLGGFRILLHDIVVKAEKVIEDLS